MKMFFNEEKKAIQMLKQLKFKNGVSFCQQCVYSNRKRCFNKTTDCQKQAIKTVLNLIEKQEKIIEKMAGHIFIDTVKDDGSHFDTEEEVIEFFENWAEKGGK